MKYNKEKKTFEISILEAITIIASTKTDNPELLKIIKEMEKHIVEESKEILKANWKKV
jgi:predicted RND superfamily exporter protein